MAYQLPELAEPEAPEKNEVVLIANGDLRLSANQMCWPAQEAMEKTIIAAIQREGWKVRRGHPYKQDEEHGFIGSQKEGMAVFKNIHPDAPVEPGLYRRLLQTRPARMAHQRRRHP